MCLPKAMKLPVDPIWKSKWKELFAFLLSQAFFKLLLFQNLILFQNFTALLSLFWTVTSPFRLVPLMWRFLVISFGNWKVLKVPVCRGIVLWKGVCSLSSPFLGVFLPSACVLGEEPASLPPLSSVGGNCSVHNTAERFLKISSDLWKKPVKLR